MTDILTLGGFSYVVRQSRAYDVGGQAYPHAHLLGISDGTKVLPVGLGVPLPVSIVSGTTSGSSSLAAPVTGQVKIAATGTPVQLPAAALVSGIAIIARSANAAQTSTYSSTVGSSAAVTTVNDGTGNGYPLAPGGSVSVSCANANQVWVNGTAGDAFAYIGS